VTRWWGVAALALSIGLNAGLLVAVLQQRWQQPAAAVVSQPAPPPALDGWSAHRPVAGADTAAGASSGADGGVAPGNATGGVAATATTASAATASGKSGSGSAGEAGRDGVAPPREPTGGAGPGRDLPEPPWPAFGAEPSLLAAADGAGAPPTAGPGAGPGAGRTTGPPQAKLEEMAERLGVPPADRPRFVALHRRFFFATHEQRLRLESVRREMRAELVSQAPDRARLDRLLVQSAELQVSLERALVDHVMEARELLDGEAEARYLHMLSRLGHGGAAGGPRGPGAAPARPPWRRPGERPPRRFGPGGGGLPPG
jgi:hypothetical protein